MIDLALSVLFMVAFAWLTSFGARTARAIPGSDLRAPVWAITLVCFMCSLGWGYVVLVLGGWL